MAHGHHEKTLPSDLSAPAFVNAWRARALIVGVVAAVVGIVLAILANSQGDHWAHFFRGWLLGFMLCFGFAVGGLAVLMVQYCSGGKWGLLIRRPLEAMTRTMPLVFVFFLPVGLGARKLYLWAMFPDPEGALKNGWINPVQAHAIAFKKPMLNVHSMWAATIVCFLIWLFYTFKLNRLSLQRDADPEPNNRFWQKKFENISGFGIVVYAITMSAGAIYWVMSLDPTWYSSVYGLQFLVSQGYGVLALVILTVIGLSKGEPFRTVLRTTEQHDLGKLAFAFVMLNMYLAFSQFLIIWSGNLPEEIPWFLDRLRGGWGYVATLDFIFHWLLPFSLLLSRDLKRNQRKLVLVCRLMIFARLWDLFWLIEPNFPDARRNLHFSFGIFEYIAIPLALVSFWLAYYFRELQQRPVVAINDPHLAELLEPEHAH